MYNIVHIMPENQIYICTFKFVAFIYIEGTQGLFKVGTTN